jgi:hypothetical protein
MNAFQMEEKLEGLDTLVHHGSHLLTDATMEDMS